MAKKATKAEIDQRLTEVQELLLDGRTRHFIIQHGSKWKVSNRQIDDYIAQATALIKEINSISIQDNMAKINTNLWKLYRASLRDSNIAEANKILMNIAKLRGLEQSNLNLVIEDKRELADLSDSDLEKILESSVEH